jgi:hypothetical protein
MPLKTKRNLLLLLTNIQQLIKETLIKILQKAKKIKQKDSLAKSQK